MVKTNIDIQINILKNIFLESEVIYVSTPINTGLRYINWYVLNKKTKNINNHDREKNKHELVVKPNIKNAKNKIENIKKKINKILVDPTNLENDDLNWSQEEFYEFWDKFIEKIVNKAIFLDGWEYSIGCCVEMLSAIKNNIPIMDERLKPISNLEILLKIEKSIGLYEKNNMIESQRICKIFSKIRSVVKNKVKFLDKQQFLKDEKLNLIKEQDIGNIARFISFEPNSEMPKIRYSCIDFEKSNTEDKGLKNNIFNLIEKAKSKSVNIRSFSKEQMKGNKLILNKNKEDIEDIVDIIRINSTENKYSIINENIDIFDSGVSGVVLGNLIEFAPEDTPKCVESQGICSLPKDIGIDILSKVYGITPTIQFPENFRVEFSIHPQRQGIKNEHTIIWEYESYEFFKYDIQIQWPNRFSRFIGDKVFGLLIADSLGFNVPKTTVISRKIAPFTFGKETGLKENWLRTAPAEKTPGKYFSGLGWKDPFELISEEDSQQKNIMSILSQNSVEAIYSGASFIGSIEKNDLIEGVKGFGDKFMLGEQAAEILPKDLLKKLKKLNNEFRLFKKELGNVSIEWVYDGREIWIVQLNQIKFQHVSKITKNTVTIVPGEVDSYIEVDVKEGLESLRNIINNYKNSNIGIRLVGDIGITSHFGDLLRLSKIPSEIKICKSSSE